MSIFSNKVIEQVNDTTNTLPLSSPTPTPTATPIPTPTPLVWPRNQALAPVNPLAGKATIFGELSNISPEKQRLELQAILNTVQNRAKQNKDTLLKILTAKGQYQAYQNPITKLPNQQYTNYIKNNLDDPSKQKANLVNEFYDKAVNGQLKDITHGATFYYHPQNNPKLANIGGAYFTNSYADLQRIIKLDTRPRLKPKPKKR